MDEKLEQGGQETEGVTTPPAASPLPDPAAAGPMLIDELAESGTAVFIPEAHDLGPEGYAGEGYAAEGFAGDGYAAEGFAGVQQRTVFGGAASDDGWLHDEQAHAAQQYTGQAYGTQPNQVQPAAGQQYADPSLAGQPDSAQPLSGQPNVFAAAESAAADQQSATSQLSSSSGMPGGEAPSSSGFSWRLPGQSPAVVHAQGGIPNEFDHLFRDSDQDNRHSLMPSQGPIGVVMPGGHAPGPGTRPTSPAESGGGSGGTGGTGEQDRPYQAPASQATPPAGYPPQTYEPTQYQQAAYQPTSQGQAVGPASTAADEHNTQAIPRVPAQPYAYGSGVPQDPGATGVALDPMGPRNSSTKPMLIAAGVFVALIVIATIAFTGGGGAKGKSSKGGSGADTPSVTATATAKSQAAALYDLILQGKDVRTRATDALTNVKACKDQATAQTTFSDIAKIRQAQADAVAKAPIDLLPAGAQQLVTDLHDAWQHSADSESSYAKWATDNAACTAKPTTNTSLNAGDKDGNAAGPLKVKAAGEWNALVVALGEPQIDQSAL